MCFCLEVVNKTPCFGCAKAIIEVTSPSKINLYYQRGQRSVERVFASRAGVSRTSLAYVFFLRGSLFWNLELALFVQH